LPVYKEKAFKAWQVRVGYGLEFALFKPEGKKTFQTQRNSLK
jgi:hypothetical protein